MQRDGAILANYNSPGNWHTLNSSTLYKATSGGYYTTSLLDLRGLLAGDESGISISNVILQEPDECRVNATTREGFMWVCDILTTVRPTEQNMSQWFRGLSNISKLPGFVQSVQATPADAGDQFLNPSQVVWGLWRLITQDPAFTMEEVSAGPPPIMAYASRVVSSGYFGEGETIVAPSMYWTRLVMVDETKTEEGGYPVKIPPANLVIMGMAVDLTTAEEITQMIRAAQR